jgi:hypothetical protein
MKCAYMVITGECVISCAKNRLSEQFLCALLVLPHQCLHHYLELLP